MYLRRHGKDYFIYALGRNGEALPNIEIEVMAYHKDFQDKQKIHKVMTDKKGKVGLGELKDINRVYATLFHNGRECKDDWMVINQEKDSWTQCEDIQIIEGEKIEIPVNHDG